MAKIIFYDATPLDTEQLSDALADTDHQWQFIPEKIETANLDPDAEVISVFVTSHVSAELIDSMPKLRLIACRSTGFNNIDFEAVQRRDITVVNVPTYGESTVAEYAFMMLLALMRKLPDVLAAENEEFSPQDLIGHDLQGKVFGVIGTGHIGQKALQIAHGFSMRTLAYDTYPSPQLEQDYNFNYVSLEQLLQESDIISLHIPYLPSTRHIMDRSHLSQMKRGAILVNTARGELVDTKALIDLLDSGHIGGAAIDVVEGEALLNQHEETALLRSQVLPEEVLRHSVEISVLKKMPNVIISPHNAFNTVEAIGRINATTAQNIIDFWYGNTPNIVKPAKKPRGKLIVTRHTESEWNAIGQWTGVTDVHLSEKGFKEAAMLGKALKETDLTIDIAYCSQQIRTRETLEAIINTTQQFEVPVITDAAINERDYGEYTGKNKWQMKDLIGEEAFNAIRRGWEVPIPGGETLKNVYERVVPFFRDNVWPRLNNGENVLLVGHGNCIRALMKYLESISDDDIANLEMLFGQILIYDLDDNGLSAKKTQLSIDTLPPANT